MNKHGQVEHVFRHEYGQLVALLLRRVGTQYINAVEDAVQFGLMQALDFWPRNGIPNNSSAWLYQVAWRQLMSELRNTQRRKELLDEQLLFSENDTANDLSDIPLPGEMNDSLLRMLFVACDDDIPVESQLVFTLKSLCGFSVREIGLRLFISEANVYKRFSRARQVLKSQSHKLDTLTDVDMETRLPMVRRILYLVFTEGYLSSHTDTAIRKDLCEEAIRLGRLISESNLSDTPETYALLALMYLHLSRINARQDTSGSLLLLEQQNRSQWNTQHITMGLSFLEQSAQGDVLSRYHVEASIAAEHCLAPTFEQTPWDKIVASYELLESISPSALNHLNRIIALAEWKGPKVGLAALQSMDIPVWLDRSYYWYAVQADLQYRCDLLDLAGESAKQAIHSAPTDHIKQLLRKRFESCC